MSHKSETIWENSRNTWAKAVNQPAEVSGKNIWTQTLVTITWGVNCLVQSSYPRTEHFFNRWVLNIWGFCLLGLQKKSEKAKTLWNFAWRAVISRVILYTLCRADKQSSSLKQGATNRIFKFCSSNAGNWPKTTIAKRQGNCFLCQRTKALIEFHFDSHAGLINAAFPSNIQLSYFFYIAENDSAIWPTCGKYFVVLRPDTVYPTAIHSSRR